MSYESAAAANDPLTAVVEAMDAAVGAAREGAGRARSTAADLVPAAGRVVARALYRTSYAVAFGVVFPAAMIAGAIPVGNAVARGFIDGALAARDAAQGRRVGVDANVAAPG